jgi:hypothetical protein
MRIVCVILALLRASYLVTHQEHRSTDRKHCRAKKFLIRLMRRLSTAGSVAVYSSKAGNAAFI